MTMKNIDEINENDEVQKYRTNVFSDVGNCMVVFSVPLLLPGLILTSVAFVDETGFSKYGVLHILGFIFLLLSVLLLLTGCFVRNAPFNVSLLCGNSIYLNTYFVCKHANYVNSFSHNLTLSST